MRPLVLFLLLLTGCATATGHPDLRGMSNCAWRVCVRAIDLPSGPAYQALNREPVPVTIVLTFRSPGNLQPGARRPIERVVPPDSDAILVRMRNIVQDPSIQPELSISIDLGSSTTESPRPHPEALHRSRGGRCVRPVRAG